MKEFLVAANILLLGGVIVLAGMHYGGWGQEDDRRDPAGPGVSGVAALEDRLARLEKEEGGPETPSAEIRDLRLRVQALERTLADSRGRIASLEEENLELQGRLEEKAADLAHMRAQPLPMEEGGPASPKVAPERRAEIFAVLEEYREMERERDQRRERERQVQGRDRRLDSYEKELELAGYQDQTFREEMVAAWDERYELYEKAQKGEMEWNDLRSGFREILDARDETLRTVLTPEQFDRFLQAEDRRWRRWGIRRLPEEARTRQGQGGTSSR